MANSVPTAENRITSLFLLRIYLINLTLSDWHGENLDSLFTFSIQILNTLIPTVLYARVFARVLGMCVCVRLWRHQLLILHI